MALQAAVHRSTVETIVVKSTLKSGAREVQAGRRTHVQMLRFRCEVEREAIAWGREDYADSTGRGSVYNPRGFPELSSGVSRPIWTLLVSHAPPINLLTHTITPHVAHYCNLLLMCCTHH